MSYKKIMQQILCQSAVCLLVVSSINKSCAKPLEQEETLSQESFAAEPAPSGESELTLMQIVPEKPYFLEQATEVSRSLRKQNRPKMSRPKVAMVVFKGEIIKGIKDETATTGENAKKKLPLNRKNSLENSLYLEELNQIIPQINHINFMP